MGKNILIILSILILSIGCNKDKINPISCENDNSMDVISTRDFNMGFSTWSFGPDEVDREETYQFITSNSDIYSEQIDNKIPWNTWINNTDLPSEFTDDIEFRVSRRLNNHQLLLSVSLLNTDRDDLEEDYDGSIPEHNTLNDTIIENAYFKHLQYLITQFNPDYLVIAMEVNDLKLKSDTKWNEYKLLMANIRSRLKAIYPNLQLSESITLHNWFNPEVDNRADYIAEITNYINQNLDFAAISFYPFFKGEHSKSEFQEAFDFLNSHVNIPIAFVETTHLAENLSISSFDLNIESNVCEQKEYLETLLLNAYNHNYKFIIWWAYRDYDELWATFPPEFQDIGKLWRDTGLLDENGKERPAYAVWKDIFNK
jgi:hypothetical protein